MSGSGWETLPVVCQWWEALSDVPEWSGVYLKCLEVVWSPSLMSRSDRDALLDVWAWLGVPPKCPAVVRRPS